MPESNQDHDSAFAMPQPMVSDSENSRTYIFQISDDEEEEDTIEKMYGPFEKVIETAPPYPTHFARIAKNAYMVRNEQIIKLRKAIKDREERLALNLQKKKEQEIQDGLNATARKMGRRITTDTRVLSSSTTSAATPPPVAAVAAATELIVIDSDSDDLMEVDITENDTASTPDDETSAAVISVNEIYASSEIEDSDEDSFETAPDIDDDMDLELQQVQQDRTSTQEEIEDLSRELEAQSSRKSDINIGILNIKVKISIENNRKQPRQKESTPTLSTLSLEDTTPPREDTPTVVTSSPKIGNKRPHTNGNHFINKRPWRTATTPSSSYSPAILAHDMSGLHMPFAQQIPPHIPYYPHQQALHHDRFISQQQFYNNRYTNSSPLRPPPPDTMPPPEAPPPSPPPNPPAYERGKSTGRQMDARHTLRRYGPALSPYADLNSPISRMENAEELQAALAHVGDLISVRIFGDEKHDGYSANVVRNLPKPRRLLTVDKRTFASSTSVCIMYGWGFELENEMKGKAVFLSPAGLPVQLEISDTHHESPLLGMLYRKYCGKPFTDVMEFAVPSIFSWIPNDVDLSTLYSNEYEGLPLYAYRLVETYNMVCDLSTAYPTTEFFAALKLEMSMYVNGRESEQFLRDCQDCVRKFPDSVDVFWQIVLAESDQIKQIHLIQEQLRSIKLLSSTDQIQYVNDDGKYFIWMSILHYYVTKALPADVCDIWMTTLVKDGTPSREKPLFTIDWENALKDNPVDRSTLRGSINILLSMLRYFGNSAIGNVNKKPLLVGVLSTLFSFLSFTKSYELIGTIVLTQQLKSSAILRDIEEIHADLTSKMNV
ncbi:hypothetical protein [Parasitella parasitica]|uniref:Uncharacterized protein n=1 Tax=Parasitella parasitica TaxID=35722 RepID=A0A0B7NEA3_9FUNG|nr:hypothetical protein [Parasitella parasitica]